MSLEYSSRGRHRTVVMPALIVLLMAALGVFYLVSRPAPTPQTMLRAIPITEAEEIETEQNEGAQATGPNEPTTIATSEAR